MHARTIVFSIVGCLAAVAAAGVSPETQKEWDSLLVKITSSLDKTEQPCYFWAPPEAKTQKVPLVVGLHTWSYSYREITSHYTDVLDWCRANGWAMVCPDFRGPNSTPQACGSDLAVQDIVDAIEYAKKAVKIDEDRVYIIGGSGGGHMALLMAGRHPEIWAGVAAFCPITDCARWYGDLVKSRRKNKVKMFESACGGAPKAGGRILEEYRHRSPLTHLENAKKAGVHIYIMTGIHDGHKGSVPVGHSFRAFNALAAEKDRFSDDEIAYIENNQAPGTLKYSGAEDPFYPEQMKIHVRRTSGNVRLTICEGGHACNYDAGFDFLKRQKRGAKVDWTLPAKAEGKAGLRQLTK